MHPYERQWEIFEQPNIAFKKMQIPTYFLNKIGFHVVWIRYWDLYLLHMSSDHVIKKLFPLYECLFFPVRAEPLDCYGEDGPLVHIKEERMRIKQNWAGA